MRFTSLIRVVGAMALLSGMLMGNADADVVTLYDPSDSFSLSHDTVPQYAYTLFQALNDVHLAGLSVTYDPGPGNTTPGFYWELSKSDASRNVGTEIVQYQGFNPAFGSPDPGLATYETPVDLNLQSAQYYILGFGVNDTPNAMPYAITQPTFTTSDGNFEVLNSNDVSGFSDTYFVVTGQLSLDVAPVPEPSTLAMFGIGVASYLLSLPLRRRRLPTT